MRRARETATAVCTIGLSLAVWPAGRTPTSSAEADTGPRWFQRVFSSATACRMAALNRVSRSWSAAGSAERMSTSIQASKGMALTEVPPPTRPTLNVVLGWRGTSRASILAMAVPAGVFLGDGLLDGGMEPGIEILERGGVGRTHVHFHPGFEGDGVDGGAAADAI